MKNNNSNYKADINRSNGNIEVAIGKKHDSKKDPVYDKFMAMCAMNDLYAVNTEGMDEKQTLITCGDLFNQNVAKVVAQIEEADKLSRKGEGSSFDLFRGGEVKGQSERTRALQKIRKENLELFLILEDTNIRTTDMLAEYSISTLGNAAGNINDFTSDIGASFGEAEDSMHSFNNAREELFFGFSSSNLTGDLIRQVQQQGVENLITNTEVIMTNNFNGMTVPEVADQILEEIESRANLSGISLSMSAA